MILIALFILSLFIAKINLPKYIDLNKGPLRQKRHKRKELTILPTESINKILSTSNPTLDDDAP